MTSCNLDGQLDGAIGKGLFRDLMSLFPGFDATLFEGVSLKQLVQFLLVAPRTLVIVEVDNAFFGSTTTG